MVRFNACDPVMISCYLCPDSSWYSCLWTYPIRFLLTGVPSKLVVVFMHNLPNGHEKHMRHAGLNNTDPGCWQHFVQQCHKVVNMTFDEGRWQWHNINSAAAQAIIDVVKETVASSENRTKPDPIVHLKGILQD